MDLLLHIGGAKTGTTSVQRFLAARRELLYRNGICYSKALCDGTGNHRWIVPLCMGSQYTDDFMTSRMLRDEESKDRALDAVLRKFISEIDRSRKECKLFIVSSEHLSLKLRRYKDICRFRELFACLFDRIKIVIYIRDPIMGSISMMSTALRYGHSIQRLPEPTDKYYHNAFSYGDTIRRWREVLPEADFTVRRYGRDFLVGESVISDFHAKMLPEFKYMTGRTNHSTNKSLSLTGMKLLYFLNQRFPPFAKGSPVRGRDLACRFMSFITDDGSLFLPSQSQYDTYKSAFRESEDFLLSNYFQDSHELFCGAPRLGSYDIDLAESEFRSNSLIEKLELTWRHISNNVE